MDDGTAGEMVASCNYWKAMSTTTSKRNSKDSDEQFASKQETGHEITGRKQDKRGDSDDGDGFGGDGFGMVAGSTPEAPCGVKWAAIQLESGNVKMEASASAVEASGFLICIFMSERDRNFRRPLDV